MKTLSKGIHVTWLFVIHFILDILTPSSIKRLILLSTVSVYLSKKGILHTETDNKLKEYINSFTNCNSYEFGQLFANTIWDKTDLLKQVDFNKQRIICDDSGCLLPSAMDDISSTIVNTTPDWLKYRSDQYKTDLINMVKGLRAERMGV